MKKIILPLLLLFSASSWAAPSVLFETSLGDFTVELDQQKAPITVKNFVNYVEKGSYNGTIFHRVIAGFMAQGGGFDKELNKVATDAPIRNEATNGLQNKVATIAMARTSNPHSATNQFFINLQDNDFLDYSRSNPGYAVFGKVTTGFEVVEMMARKPTGSQKGMQDVPLTPIVINKATIIK